MLAGTFSEVSIRAGLLILCVTVAACGKTSLDEESVRAFIDAADDAARRGDASEICAMRGREFTATWQLKSEGRRHNSSGTAQRRAFCSSAVSFAGLQQYELARQSIEIKLAPDALTATVVANYEEKYPFFDPSMTRLTPGEFDDYAIVKTLDNSEVGIEDGEIVFLSTTSDSWQTLVPKTQMYVRRR